MKKLFSFIFALFLAIQPGILIKISTITVSAQMSETVQEVLTNSTILQLTKAGIPTEAIVEKIKQSKANFDLSTGALQELKTSGVADAVIVAMMQSGKSVEAAPVAKKEIELTIPDGTEVEVELKNNLSGQDAKIGDVVDLRIVRDIEVNGRKAFVAGSSANARITNAKKAGYWGKSGKLEWAMQDIQTVTGTRIPSRFTKALSGGSKSGTVAVGAVVTTVLLGPVGLLWGLKKGKKAIIPAGTKFSVYVDKDAKIMVSE